MGSPFTNRNICAGTLNGSRGTCVGDSGEILCITLIFHNIRTKGGPLAQGYGIVQF